MFLASGVPKALEKCNTIKRHIQTKKKQFVKRVQNAFMESISNVFFSSVMLSFTAKNIYNWIHKYQLDSICCAIAIVSLIEIQARGFWTKRRGCVKLSTTVCQTNLIVHKLHTHTRTIFAIGCLLGVVYEYLFWDRLSHVSSFLHLSYSVYTQTNMLLRVHIFIVIISKKIARDCVSLWFKWFFLTLRFQQTHSIRTGGVNKVNIYKFNCTKWSIWLHAVKLWDSLNSFS